MQPKFVAMLGVLVLLAAGVASVQAVDHSCSAVPTCLEGPGTDSALMPWTDDGTVVRVTDAGDKVGVGTSSPASVLHVRDTGAADQAKVFTIGDNTQSDRYQFVADNGGGGLFYLNAGEARIRANGHLRFQVNAENTDRLYIKSNGNVGIGDTNPGNLLTIQQSSSTDPIADAWTTYSSRRWKENIENIDHPLAKIEALRGVYYDWKADGKHDIGLIAEEVGAVIPEVVLFEPNGVDARSVDYARLVALLIEGVKAQQAQIDDLEARLAAALPADALLE